MIEVSGMGIGRRWSVQGLGREGKASGMTQV